MTNDFLEGVSGSRSGIRRHLHIVEGKAVRAWRNRSLSGSLDSARQQLDVRLLVLSNELQVFEEVFAEAGLLEVVLAEQRQSRLVEDIFQMLKLSQSVSGGVS